MAPANRPNGPAEPSEGLGPGGWMEYDWPMDRNSGPCPGTCATPNAVSTIPRITPNTVCPIPQTTPDAVSTITRTTPDVIRTIPAPNGGRESSPGMSNAIPWDRVPPPPPIMHPNGVREHAAMTPRASQSIDRNKPSADPAGEEVGG